MTPCPGVSLDEAEKWQSGGSAAATALGKEGPVQALQWCEGPATEWRPERDLRGGGCLLLGFVLPDQPLPKSAGADFQAYECVCVCFGRVDLPFVEQD